jgi:uncharacterized protein YjbJ (UPF0337 family)
MLVPVLRVTGAVGSLTKLTTMGANTMTDRFQMIGQLNQLKGKIKEQWGELTDDDILQAQGNIDQLIGKIQEKYGGTREEIRKQIEEMRSGM